MKKALKFFYLIALVTFYFVFYAVVDFLLGTVGMFTPAIAIIFKIIIVIVAGIILIKSIFIDINI